MITQEFDLNLIPDQEPVIVHVSQYDIGGGRLIAHLYNGDLAYTPAAGATVIIQGTKPDKFGFMYDASFEGNTVTADLTEQMCAVAGRTVVNIIVTENSNRTGTFNFFLDVQKAALGNDTVISRSDGSIYDISDLVESAEEYAERAETAAENSQNSSYDSEAWAKGTRNGTAVTPSDETYQNNSRYFSEVSGNYVEDSEAWAVGKRGGAAVPSTDSTYHNNSKYYAEQAEDSADHAADIVNDANYLIGVDPSAITPPTTPYLRPSDVVDNLASAVTDKPLSANQGKVLKGLIDAIDPSPSGDYLQKSDVIDNLISTLTEQPLSANQGKVLKGLIDLCVAKSDIINNLVSEATDKPLSAYQGYLLRRNKVNVSDVVDNLTSTATDKPLSANQGKVLKELISSSSGSDIRISSAFGITAYGNESCTSQGITILSDAMQYVHINLPEHDQQYQNATIYSVDFLYENTETVNSSRLMCLKTMMLSNNKIAFFIINLGTSDVGVMTVAARIVWTPAS